MVTTLHPGDNFATSPDIESFTPEPLGAQDSIERELLGLVQMLAEAVAHQNNQINLLKRHLCLVERQLAGKAVRS